MMTMPHSAYHLLHLLDTGAAPERARAHSQLVALGAQAVDPLVEAVRAGRGRSAWQGLRILIEIDALRAWPVIKEALYADSPLLAQTAASVLAQYGIRAVPVLIHALPHVPYIVQLAVVTSLIEIGDKRAVAPLMDLLTCTDSDTLRYTIIQGLGVLGVHEAVPLIAPYQDDENHHVRKRARTALVRLGALGPTASHNNATHRPTEEQS